MHEPNIIPKRQEEILSNDDDDDDDDILARENTLVESIESDIMLCIFIYFSSVAKNKFLFRREVAAVASNGRIKCCLL